MSVIFSGLQRLTFGVENQLNWNYFEVTDVTTINGERNLMELSIDSEHEILLDQCFELEYEGTSTEVITTCERCSFFCTKDFFQFSAGLCMPAIDKVYCKNVDRY